jgi:hypothetical protein
VDDQQQASFGSQLARWDLTVCPMTLFWVCGECGFLVPRVVNVSVVGPIVLPDQPCNFTSSPVLEIEYTVTSMLQTWTIMSDSNPVSSSRSTNFSTSGPGERATKAAG